MIEKIFYGGNTAGENNGLQEMDIKRVAAYCRVSTVMDIQQSSLETQMQVFGRKISEHPGWKLAGVYADEGITGTSVKNRKEFLRMMEDCKKGKIDYIITKSISRFARNTVECLSYVRELQSMGVQVLFEKENVDTGTAFSEMLLTVLAAFAQEESRSISENLKWGLRKRFEAGEARWAPLYGYRHLESGEIVEEPAEAQIVRKVFDLYEKGKTMSQVARQMNEMNVLSPGGTRWTVASVSQMLMNERYAGDIVMQKWVTVDHISHKRIKNNATRVPSYYVKDHHVPLVERRTFERVKKIRGFRDCNHHHIPQYPYGDIKMPCPLCGQPLVQRMMQSQKKKKAWCCFGEKGCQRYAIKSYLLDAAVLEAYYNWQIKTAAGADQTVAGADAISEVKAVFEADTMSKAYIMSEVDTMSRVNQISITDTKTVEYFWLDNLVEMIEPGCDALLNVHWKDGSKSSGRLAYERKEEPGHVAQLYRQYLERLSSGQYIPAQPRDWIEETAVRRAMEN